MKEINVNQSVQKLTEAFQHALSIRPKVGGFPVLAEVLRQAGVKRNIWTLPSCQSIYMMDTGHIVNQGAPLLTGMAGILKFDEAALIKALRIDQNGESTFPEFLDACWRAGVVSYDVDFEKRTCTYYGVLGESYKEEYVAIKL